MHGYNTRRPHTSLGYRPPAPEAHHPVISNQRNSTLAGCDVDSHSAWYKTSVRSSQSLLMTLSRRVRQAEENTERREAHWRVMKRGQHPMYARGQEKPLTFGLAPEEEHWQTPQGPVSL